jgi:type I restriction enzyme S subunit
MMESEKVDALPKGWTWAELNDFSDIVLGQSPPSSTYNEDHIGLPFYQGKLEFSSIYPTPRKWCSVPKKIAEKGDVLISVRAPVGPTNICPEKSCIGRGLAAIRGKAGIEPFFMLYLIRSVENALSKSGTGTTFDAINGDQLKLLRLPLAPLPEQHRIVAKIEELFSHLDVGVWALQKAKAQIRRYRQAVLKAAMEGRLTEGWRKVHPEVEPAEKLLDYILSIQKKTRNSMHERLLPVDKAHLWEIPESWIWVRTGDVCEGIVPGRTKPKNFKGSIPWITLPDVNDLYISNSKNGLGVTKEDAENVGMKVMQEGTVLISCVGQFGIICIAKNILVPNQQFHGFACSNGIIPEYLVSSQLCKVG